MYFSDRNIEIDFLRFMPEHLIVQAESFVEYTTLVPYARPSQCPHCKSSPVYFNGYVNGTVL